MDEVENRVKMIVEPKKNISYYFLRNMWIFVVYVFLCILSIFLKIYINSIMGENADSFKKILNKVLLISFFLILIVYIYKTIVLYLSTRKIKYVFYDTYVKYNDNFVNKEQKQISYEHISEVTVKQSVLDRILKTGYIYLNTPVESNSGIFLSFVEKPYEIAQNIRNIIES